ncbi:MAG TPA: hypothetical protein VLJ38_16660 [Polyangiaceae bacterium]|nr:hypothetical protein [Polyangiaceae bacterium]
MTPDEPDGALERLFRAARSETPRSDVRSRAVERAVASTRVRSRRRGLTLGLVLAAAAGVAFAFGLQHFPAVGISVGPERLPPSTHPNPTPDLPAHPTRPAPASATPTARADTSADATRLDKPTVPRPAPTLGQELALLQAARAALDAGDGKHALALLDHYARSTQKPRLADEATVVRLEALSRTGRGAEAAKLAREFVAEHPGSPLVDRARAFITTPKTAASAVEPEGTP